MRIITALICTGVGVAHGQTFSEPPDVAPSLPQGDPEDVGPTEDYRPESATLSVDTRRRGRDQATAQTRELELHTGVTYVSSRGDTGRRYAFTDLGLGHLALTYSPYGKVRLALGGSMVIKQPADTNHRIFNSADASIRMDLARHWALDVGGEFGSMVERQGYYGKGYAGLLGRRRMNEFTLWEASVGAVGTRLAATDDTPQWLVEARGHGSAQICFNRCAYDYGAAWVDVSYAAPLATRDARLDPQPQLGLTVGAYVKVSPQWSMTASYAWLDRGDGSAPATQLPLLNGGFDQNQLMLGLIWAKASEE